jgi:hypothetical protein
VSPAKRMIVDHKVRALLVSVVDIGIYTNVYRGNLAFKGESKSLK